MLTLAAIGDAYGAGFEYATPEFVALHNDLSGYVKHQKHDITPGSYTDDTQMSIAIAEVLLSGKWSREALANAFVDCFRRDIRKGYAGKFYDLLTTCNTGADLLARIVPHSDKSGASMRALPIGLLRDIKQVKDYANLQARITHDTDDGANAAIAAALICHYFRFQLGSRAALPAFLKAEVPGDWDVPYTGKVGEKGWMSVRAAITALTTTTSQSALLLACVAFTGDVDTVATIALGASALCSEYSNDLPAHLLASLENGAYGRDFLQDLDKKLLAAFPAG